MAPFLWSLASWSPAMASEPFPCFDTSEECLEILTEAAIARSREADLIARQIELAEQRGELYEETTQEQRSRTWTAWLTLDPIETIGNLFGGGPRQQRELQIQELELRQQAISAQSFALEIRGGELRDGLRSQIFQSLQRFQELGRELERVESAIASHQTQYQVFLAGYRHGNGSTQQLLNLQQREVELNSKIEELQSQVNLTIRELEELTGYELQ